MILARALEAAEHWEAAPTGSADQHAAAETATGMIFLLHRELHEGGHLPAPWCNAQPPVMTGYISGSCG